MGLSGRFPPSVAGQLRRTGALPLLRTASIRRGEFHEPPFLSFRVQSVFHPWLNFQYLG